MIKYRTEYLKLPSSFFLTEINLNEYITSKTLKLFEDQESYLN